MKKKTNIFKINNNSKLANPKINWLETNRSTSIYMIELDLDEKGRGPLQASFTGALIIRLE